MSDQKFRVAWMTQAGSMSISDMLTEQKADEMAMAQTLCGAVFVQKVVQIRDGFHPEGSLWGVPNATTSQEAADSIRAITFEEVFTSRANKSIFDEGVHVGITGPTLADLAAEDEGAA